MSNTTHNIDFEYKIDQSDVLFSTSEGIHGLRKQDESWADVWGYIRRKGAKSLPIACGSSLASSGAAVQTAMRDRLQL